MIKKEVTIKKLNNISFNYLHFHVVGTNIIITGAKVASSYLKIFTNRNCNKVFWFRFLPNQNPFDLISKRPLLDEIIDWDNGNLTLSKLEAHKIFISRNLSEYSITILHRDIKNRVLSGLVQDMKRDHGRSYLEHKLTKFPFVDNFVSQYFESNSFYRGGDHVYSYTFNLILFFQNVFTKKKYKIENFESFKFLYIEDDKDALSNLLYSTSGLFLESIKEQGKAIFNSNSKYIKVLENWFTNSKSDSNKRLKNFITAEQFIFGQYFHYVTYAD